MEKTCRNCAYLKDLWYWEDNEKKYGDVCTMPEDVCMIPRNLDSGCEEWKDCTVRTVRKMTNEEAIDWSE